MLVNPDLLKKTIFWKFAIEHTRNLCTINNLSIHNFCLQTKMTYMELSLTHIEMLRDRKWESIPKFDHYKKIKHTSSYDKFSKYITLKCFFFTFGFPSYRH